MELVTISAWADMIKTMIDACDWSHAVDSVLEKCDAGSCSDELQLFSLIKYAVIKDRPQILNALLQRLKLTETHQKSINLVLMRAVEREFVSVAMVLKRAMQEHSIPISSDVFHKIVQSGNKRMLRAFKWCKELKSRNSQGETPMFAAVRSGNLSMVKRLIKYGIPVDSNNMHMQTPLSWAVRLGQLTIAKCLLDHGANVNQIASSQANLSIHYAAKEGYVELVRLLMKRGAIAKKENVRGETALDMARKEKHPICESIMLEYTT